MKFPFITYKQASEILGVTEPHVRHLVKDGKIPKPITLGPRVNLLVRTQIESIAAGEGHTMFVDSVPRPEQPLKKRVDAVVDGRGRMPDFLDGPQYFHVRIYTPADRSYEIVVIGQMTGTIMAPSNRIQTVAREVLPLVQAELEETLWLTIDPRDSLNDHHITAEALTYGAATPYQAQWDQGSVIEGLPAFTSSTLTEIDFDELVSLLGQAPEWYHGHAYGREVVEYWQRNQRPKQVTVDPRGMIPLVAAAKTLSSDAIDGSYSVVSRDALTVVTHELLRREQSPVPLERPRTPEAATTVTSLDRPYMVDFDTLPAVGAEDLAMEKHPDLVRELRAWRREVDEYSRTPDRELTAAIDLALAVAVMSLRREAFLAGTRLEPEVEFDVPERVRSAEIGGAWDQRWLRNLRPVSPDDAALRRQIAIISANSLSVGSYLADDRTGAFVGVEDPDLTVGSYFTYLVTTEPVSFDPNDRIVADGTGGHRPLYLLQSGGQLRLFPEVRSEVHRDMWNFGYSGGSPGHTAHDIVTILRHNEVPGVGVQAGRRIDSLICDKRFHDELDVSIRELVPSVAD